MWSLLRGRPLRHPVHPIVLHFAVALLVLSLALDFLSLVLEEGGVYLEASIYVMTAGFAAAILAMVPGLADLLGIRRDSPSFRTGLVHMALMVLMAGAFGVNLWLRWGRWDDGFASDARVDSLTFLLSLAGMGVLGVGAWFGGRLVYGDGVGVGRHRRAVLPPPRTIVASAERSRDGFAAIAPEGAVAEGGALRVEVDGVVMVVARVQGDLFAFGEFCTHRFGPLSDGSIHDCSVQCPWHGSEFDVRTGEAVAGPAKTPINTFPVRVREAQIEVRVAAP